MEITKAKKTLTIKGMLRNLKVGDAIDFDFMVATEHYVRNACSQLNNEEGMKLNPTRLDYRTIRVINNA